MRRIATAAVLAGALLGMGSVSVATEASAAPPLVIGAEPVGPVPIVEAQYAFGGRNYCWYPNAWRGPGYYWCGYAWRRGFGWGGGYGWRGWHEPGWRGGRPGWHGGHGGHGWHR
jgi:hypothetical protein